MSYVDALWDRDKDIIKVVERNKKGEREFREFPARYVFYYGDGKGKQKSTFGDPVSRVVCKSWKDFLKEQKINKHIDNKIKLFLDLSLVLLRSYQRPASRRSLWVKQFHQKCF